MQSIRIHLLRHGRVASHRGDVPVTDEGLAEVEAAGRSLAEDIADGELVRFLYAPTRRARETAHTLRASVAASLDGARQICLSSPAEEWAVRNPDVYIGGLRVEMVSNAEAMAEQTAAIGLGPDAVDDIAFYHAFFRSPDRIGYWVAHPDPPGEDAEAVARRVMAFCASLRDRVRSPEATTPSGPPATRYVCITHSPVLRAFLRRYLLGEDPGEPDFVESIDVTCWDEESVAVRFRDREREVRPAGRAGKPSGSTE